MVGTVLKYQTRNSRRFVHGMLLEDMLLRSLVVLLLWTSAAVVDGLPRTGGSDEAVCMKKWLEKFVVVNCSSAW